MNRYGISHLLSGEHDCRASLQILNEGLLLRVHRLAVILRLCKSSPLLSDCELRGRQLASVCFDPAIDVRAEDPRSAFGASAH